MRVARDLAARFRGHLADPAVEKDRLDVPDPFPLDLDVLVARVLLRRALRLVEHAGQFRRVEMTLVEETLCGLDDRRDDAGLRHHAAHRADRARPRPLCDLTDLELQSRGACECVASLVHRRRTGVRSLSATGHLVTLDAE